MIKGGTIVTADMTYRSDVLVDRGVITAIGSDLRGDTQLDAADCYVMPGGIDPLPGGFLPRCISARSPASYSPGSPRYLAKG